MDAGTFHVAAVTGRGRVVHRQQESIAKPWSQLLYDQAEQRRGHACRSPAHTDQAIVEPIPIILHATRHEPGTGRAPIARQKHPSDHDRHPEGDRQDQSSNQYADRLKCSLLYERQRMASELSGRRLKKFSERQAARRVAEHIGDFSPLRQLDAFRRLENDLRQALEANGWN